MLLHPEPGPRWYFASRSKPPPGPLMGTDAGLAGSGHGGAIAGDRNLQKPIVTIDTAPGHPMARPVARRTERPTIQIVADRSSAAGTPAPFVRRQGDSTLDAAV